MLVGNSVSFVNGRCSRSTPACVSTAEAPATLEKYRTARSTKRDDAVSISINGGTAFMLQGPGGDVNTRSASACSLCSPHMTRRQIERTLKYRAPKDQNLPRTASEFDCQASFGSTTLLGGTRREPAVHWEYLQVRRLDTGMGSILRLQARIHHQTARTIPKNLMYC